MIMVHNYMLLTWIVSNAYTYYTFFSLAYIFFFFTNNIPIVYDVFETPDEIKRLIVIFIYMANKDTMIKHLLVILSLIESR